MALSSMFECRRRYFLQFLSCSSPLERSLGCLLVPELFSFPSFLHFVSYPCYLSFLSSHFILLLRLSCFVHALTQPSLHRKKSKTKKRRKNKKKTKRKKRGKKVDEYILVDIFSDTNVKGKVLKK